MRLAVARGDPPHATAQRRRAMKTRIILVCVIVLFRIASDAGAQSTLANMVGIVQDQSGLVMPGVTIQLQNLDESTKVETISDGAGAFQFLNLKPGRYAMVASLVKHFA
jgi:hypothetical protein